MFELHHICKGSVGYLLCYDFDLHQYEPFLILQQQHLTGFTTYNAVCLCVDLEAYQQLRIFVPGINQVIDYFCLPL
jgi:hypothetical protein